jgi:hypothetical protein
MGAMNRIFRAALSACLPFLSAAALAVTYDLATLGGALDVSSTGSGEIVLVQSDPGTATTNFVNVLAGVTATVRLSGVNISNRTHAAITVQPGAELTLRLDGTNFLAGGPGHAGLCVPSVDGVDASVRIAAGESAGGLLVATGGLGGAGIGGDAAQPGGAVRVEGGEVRAIAGSGAGIGGGNRGGRGGSFAMTGGSVLAQGKAGGAGIGGGGRTDGAGGAGGTVEISGGTLTALGSPSGAGIGGGNNAAGGTVRISGGRVEASGGAGAAGIGGGAGTGGDGGDVQVSGGWTRAEGDAIAAPASLLSIAGAAAVGGGSSGDGGSLAVTGGSLIGEPLGTYGGIPWTAGPVSNGEAEVFPVPLAALPDGAAIDLGTYVYRYAGEGGTDGICFHLPAGTFALCADDTGETQYARISVSEDGRATVVSAPAVSLAWADGEPVLSFSGGWPGLEWVWQVTTNLLDGASWTDGSRPPEGATRAFWRLHSAE